MNKPLSALDKQTFAVFCDGIHQGNCALVILANLSNAALSLQQQFELTLEAKATASGLITLSQAGEHKVRWANAQQEIQFCGHGALAAAAFLDSKGMLNKESNIQFPAGKYWLCYENDLYWLSSKSQTEISASDYSHTAELLGQEVIETATCMGPQGYLIVRISDNTDLRELEPNLRVLKSTTDRALILTSRQTQHSDFDYSLRYFAPQYGMAEDPATGSANEIAAQFWCPRINKSELSCYQASNAGGVIYARKDDNDDIWIGGKVAAL